MVPDAINATYEDFGSYAEVVSSGVQYFGAELVKRDFSLAHESSSTVIMNKPKIKIARRGMRTGILIDRIAITMAIISALMIALSVFAFVVKEYNTTLFVAFAAIGSAVMAFRLMRDKPWLLQ
jgi:hypothetical protein